MKNSPFVFKRRASFFSLASVDGFGVFGGFGVAGESMLGCRVPGAGGSGLSQCRVAAFHVSGLRESDFLFITISHCAWRHVIPFVQSPKATKKRSKENAFQPHYPKRRFQKDMKGAVNFMGKLLTLVVMTKVKGMEKPIVDDELWKRNRALTATAEASTREVPRSQAGTRSRSIERHFVCVAHRAALARSTRRNGLRLWGDLLAPLARLARSRRVGSIARTAAWGVTCSRPNRSLTRDSRFVFRPGYRGGPKTGPNPVDRARPGSKHHVATDANGGLLSIILTGANRNDITQLLPLIDAIPPIRGIRGRPLKKPQVVYADRGYDSDVLRQKLRDRGIKPVLAKRRSEHGGGLGKYRWVVERSHAWFHNFHRLRVRYERLAKIREAFLKFAACLICWSALKRSVQPFFLKPSLSVHRVQFLFMGTPKARCSPLDDIPDTARVPSQVKNDVIAIVKGRLPVARESWMEAIKNTCLENQAWDDAKQYVVKPNLAGRTLVNIQAGTYDPAEHLTVLHLADRTQVGIKL